MSFWTGLEAITGHPAGAFKGMSMSDWFDNEKWQRMPRTWSGQMQPKNRLDLRTNRAGEPMHTKWFNQRGWDQLPQQADNRESTHVQDLPSYEEQFTEIMRNRYPGGPDKVSAANLQYPNIGQGTAMSLQPDWTGAALTEDRDTGMGAGRFLQLGDPQNIRSGPDLPPASKKTVKKIFADPNKSNEIIETIEEKVPTGSAQWGNSRHPRNWLQRNDEGYFSRPQTSLMNMNQPGFLEKLGLGMGKFYSDGWDNSALGKGFDVGKRFSDRAAKGWDAVKDLARKRHEEEMLRRQRGY